MQIKFMVWMTTMNKPKEFELKLRDNKNLHMYRWDNVKNPKAIVQLVHGSCEYAIRYQHFADFLNDHDYIVIADDHRGHGKTVKNKVDFGFFANNNGWQIAVDDLYEVNQYINHQYPNLPVVMFGHSMGSFLAQHYAIQHSKTLKASIFCGTAYRNKFLLKIAKMLALHHQKKYGLKFNDHLIYNLSYVPLNNKFKKEGKSGVEWITSDKNIQTAFLKDSLIFPVFTASGYKDMFTGMLYIQNKKNIEKTSHQLPMLFLSGKNDPVGKFGRGVNKTYKIYLKLGYNVKIKLYKDMRHEIWNEKNKLEVYQDVLNFYDNNI